MNYLLKSSNLENRRKTIRKNIFLIILVLAIIILIISTNPVRNGLFFIAQPIWKIKNLVVNSNFFEYFKTKQTLIEEKISLEQKLFLVGNLQAMNTVLQSENDSLKDLLGRKDIKGETILASILVKPPQTPYDILIVDLGESDRVKIGDKVIANANIYIGEVSEVSPHTAKVTLYSTPGRKLSVILGANSVTAEAIGIGGGNFNILLPREVEVKEGDIITIPSITANVFGIVEKVSFKDKDSFQTVLFKSPINVYELNFVEIVL